MGEDKLGFCLVCKRISRAEIDKTPCTKAVSA